MRLEWKLQDGNLVGQHGEFTAILALRASIGCNYWELKKAGEIIDNAYRHKPKQGEGEGKAQIERIIAKMEKEGDK